MNLIRVALMFQAFLLFAFPITSDAQTGYNKEAFYDAMGSSDLKVLDQEIQQAEKATGTEKQAMIGALTMKKAGLVSGPGKKLRTFKAGAKELEAAIKQQNNNGEFRFMRLMIQENAPGILGYKSEIESDKDYIRKSFKTLSRPAQKAIIHYAKSSKVLSEKDFN